MEIFGEFNTSVEKALSEIDPDWKNYKGLIICGTHSPEVLESLRQISLIKEAREAGKPFLGICYGHQLAAIEYARNVLGHPNASSEEWGKDWNILAGGDPVVYKLPQLKVGLHDGESYWNNYEVLPEFLKMWEKAENFITIQFHPEYQSSKEKPHPVLLDFLTHAKKYTMEM